MLGYEDHHLEKEFLDYPDGYYRGFQNQGNNWRSFEKPVKLGMNTMTGAQRT